MAHLSDQILEFIANRLADRLVRFDKATPKELENGATPEERAAARELEIAEHEPTAWLTTVAQSAKFIKAATHPIKFSHPDAKGSSILACAPVEPVTHICTAAIAQLSVDAAGAAGSLPAIAILSLVDDTGKSVADYVREGNREPFESIEFESAIVDQWMEDFLRSLTNQTLMADQLSRQVYFPVGDDYHLLAPLYGSSLQQAIWDRVEPWHVSDEEKERLKELRKCRRENKYNPIPLRVYTRLAKMGFGGAQPQNISKLALARKGISFLVCGQPPIWRESELPSLKSKFSFWRSYGKLSWRTFKSLQGYLLSHVNHISTLRIRQTRADYLEQAISLLFQHAGEIQQKGEPGWSRDSDLSRAEQLWLDPYRGLTEPDFEAERALGEWQAEIADQFGRHVNHQLEHKDMNFGDPEYHEWTRLLERRLAVVKLNVGAM